MEEKLVMGEALAALALLAAIWIAWHRHKEHPLAPTPIEMAVMSGLVMAWAATAMLEYRWRSWFLVALFLMGIGRSIRHASKLGLRNYFLTQHGFPLFGWLMAAGWLFFLLAGVLMRIEAFTLSRYAFFAAVAGLLAGAIGMGYGILRTWIPILLDQFKKKS